MEKQFVTYEIALKLKELGFNEEVMATYNTDKIDNQERELKIFAFTVPNKGIFEVGFLKGWCIKASLWQQVIDWFREKQNICINIEPITFDDEPTYIFEIINLKNGRLLNNISNSFTDTNEAREQAILEALELIAQNRTK